MAHLATARTRSPARPVDRGLKPPGGEAPPPTPLGWRLTAVLFVAALLLWEALARAGAISEFYFPGPSRIAETLGHFGYATPRGAAQTARR